jgi:ubiquinone/menaquinone biosynthesis C-methylase UbiE
MAEQEYVLGTHDEELARLGVQHEVWRDRMLQICREAGFGPGSKIVDLGCGPGFATLDLADLVGPSGSVTAVDQSLRFLAALRAAASERSLRNIETRQVNLDAWELPASDVDGVWCRWVMAFVSQPEELVEKVRHVLKIGGVFVLQEYLHYATWRLSPKSAAFEEFVRQVIETWRASAGEPDIGLDLPRLLERHGFTIERVRPIVDLMTPELPGWQWPRTFVETGLHRLASLGVMSKAAADATWEIFLEAERNPETRMVTPLTVQIVARRV